MTNDTSSKLTTLTALLLAGFGGFSGFSGCDKSASETPQPEPIKDAQAETLPDGFTDAPADVPVDAPTDAPPGKCAEGLRPPKLVHLTATNGTGYCMDQREVTAREYQEFMQAKNGDTSGQIATCAWNKEWMGPLTLPDAWEIMPYECEGRGYDPENYPNRAVGCVDWCDAHAYCAWAGKRLCGKVGGGAGSLEIIDDAAQSEWANACTQGGKTKYPWGDTYVAGRCVDNTAIKKAGVAARDIADVDSSDCHGADPGFDQVYDLIGSVQEWGAECLPSGQGCALHGYGSMTSSGGPAVSCSAASPAVSMRHFELGFRCCADEAK